MFAGYVGLGSLGVLSRVYITVSRYNDLYKLPILKSSLRSPETYNKGNNAHPQMTNLNNHMRALLNEMSQLLDVICHGGGG